MNVQKIKDNLLLFAMSAGVIGYFVIDILPLDTQIRHWIGQAVTSILPFLLFSMLFLEFSKIDPKDLLPKKWIWLCFGYQIVTALLMIALIRFISFPYWVTALWMGVMVCVLSPTATAVAVMSSKLGGKAASATTYAVLSSLFTAVAVPLLFPLVSPDSQTISFLPLFLKIFRKVFGVIIVPLLISFAMRAATPKWHNAVSAFAKDKSFYLWSVCIMINTAQITRLLCMGLVSTQVTILYIVLSLAMCMLNFWIGKAFGMTCDDRISAGQSLGQKNTILAIWIGMSFLSPASGIFMGAYMIWQNVFNSMQLTMPRLR